jgi:hypothetical protein
MLAIAIIIGSIQRAVYHYLPAEAIHGFKGAAVFIARLKNPWFSTRSPNEPVAILLAGSVFTYSSCENAGHSIAMRQIANNIFFMVILLRKII